MNKENLIDDFTTLFFKYEEMDAGTIIDIAICCSTVFACYAANNNGELDTVHDYLYKIIKKHCDLAISNIKKTPESLKNLENQKNFVFGTSPVKNTYWVFTDDSNSQIEKKESMKE